MLWAGIVATAGAHSCIAWAISRCSAVLPSTYGTMQPVVTGVLAALVLGQVMTSIVATRRPSSYLKKNFVQPA